MTTVRENGGTRSRSLGAWLNSGIARKLKRPPSVSGVRSMLISELRDVCAISLLIIDCTNLPLKKRHFQQLKAIDFCLSVTLNLAGTLPARRCSNDSGRGMAG